MKQKRAQSHLNYTLQLQLEAQKLGYPTDATGFELEVDVLLALVLNTFVWRIWRDLGLSSQQELAVEFKKVLDALVLDVIASFKQIGHKWTLILLRDTPDLLLSWLCRSTRPFQLDSDQNRLINREQAYSRVVMGKLVDECVLTTSRIQRDFLVGVLDGVVMKALIEGYSDNFAIWGPLLKVLSGHEADSASRRGKTHRSRWRFLNLMQTHPALTYADLVPLLRLLAHTTQLYQYPILWTMLTMSLQLVLAIPIFNTVLTNYIYACVEDTVNVETMTEAICALKSTLYPFTDNPTQWGLRPRWEPSNITELQDLKARCQTSVAEHVTKIQATRLGWLIVDPEADSNAISAYLVNLFQDKPTNKALLWSLVELLLGHVLKERVSRV